MYRIMKVFICSLLCLSLVYASAFAAGADPSGLTVAEDRLYEVPDARDAFYYTKVSNDTDAPIVCGSVVFSSYDAQGELLKESKLSTNPFNVVIQPGEYLYLHANISNDVFKEKNIDQYDTVPTLSRQSVEVVRHRSEGKLVFDDKTGELSYIEVSLTNDAESMIYDWYIDFGVYDDQGQLMYASGVWYDIGLTSGSTLVKRFKVDTNLARYLGENDIRAAAVDCICYTRK